MPKKPLLQCEWDDFDVDENDYMYQRDCTTNVRSSDDYYDEETLFAQLSGDVPTTEEEQLRIALEISKLDQSSSQVKDIRKSSDITEGMAVEIVLLGQEKSRQRTQGTVVRILSSGWDVDGIVVEISHGIIGRITGLCGEKFVPTQFSLSTVPGEPQVPQEVESDDYLWSPLPEEANSEGDDNSLCPIGCGTSLSDFGDDEINHHIDNCLRVTSLAKLYDK